jgi:hypothetical protein
MCAVLVSFATRHLDEFGGDTGARACNAQESHVRLGKAGGQGCDGGRARDASVGWHAAAADDDEGRGGLAWFGLVWFGVVR